MQGTQVVWLQNGAGYSRWGPTENRVEALKEAFRPHRERDRPTGNLTSTVQTTTISSTSPNSVITTCVGLTNHQHQQHAIHTTNNNSTTLGFTPSVSTNILNNSSSPNMANVQSTTTTLTGSPSMTSSSALTYSVTLSGVAVASQSCTSSMITSSSISSPSANSISSGYGSSNKSPSPLSPHTPPSNYQTSSASPSLSVQSDCSSPSSSRASPSMSPASFIDTTIINVTLLKNNNCSNNSIPVGTTAPTTNIWTTTPLTTRAVAMSVAVPTTTTSSCLSSTSPIRSSTSTADSATSTSAVASTAAFGSFVSGANPVNTAVTSAVVTVINSTV